MGLQWRPSLILSWNSILFLNEVKFESFMHEIVIGIDN